MERETPLDQHELEGIETFKSFDRDFADRYVGERVKIGDIVGVPIAVLNYVTFTSRFNAAQAYVIIQAQQSGKLIVFGTGSQVIAKQLAQYKEKLPFVTTIERRKRYYTFT